MKITEYTVEEIKDPTGILVGRRYEFFLHIEIEDEEDELFDEDNLQLKVIYSSNDSEKRILSYHFIESAENKILDFALDEEEEKIIDQFCKEHLPEAE